MVTAEFQTALKSLLESSLPMTTAFKLRGIAKIIGEEHKKYDEMRLELLQKYADKKEDGSLDVDEESGMARFTGNNIAKFTQDLNELASVEVELPTISVSELEGMDNFTAKDFIYLDELIGE